MKTALLLPLPLEMLALAFVATASRLGSPPLPTQTPEDGANAALHRPSPTPTPNAQLGAMELLRARDEYTMGQDTCGFGLNQSEIISIEAQCSVAGGVRCLTNWDKKNPEK